MKKKASVVLAAAVAATLALTGSAFGGSAYELKVKIKPVSDTKLEFKGKVVADEVCRKGRKVSFKADGSRLAKTKTDENGKFSVVGKRPEAGTEIVAKLKPKGEDCPKLVATGAAP